VSDRQPAAEPAESKEVDGHGEAAAAPQRRALRRWLRLLLLATVILGLFVVGRVTGLSEQIDIDNLRKNVAAAGAWGVLLYLAAFTLGLLIHVPGVAFVGAAIFLYGRFAGAGLALVGAMLAVCVSFFVSRAIGGKVLHEIESPWMKRLLARVHEKPIRTIVLLRLAFWMLPPLNYALAMTNVRFRDFLIGSAIGLAPVIAAVALFFDWLFQWL
jgi:uncharacterized membrane protein YdjX (TVP38/TMEM64 family)